MNRQNTINKFTGSNQVSSHFVDSGSLVVKETAKRLTKNAQTDEEKLKAIFYFVRDEIEFGFLKESDFVKASDVIERRKGQCNNKSIVFKALCDATGLESRIHYASIDKAIHTGLYKGIVYKLMPPEISHSWIEVNYNGKWVAIDNYVNDIRFYEKGKALLRAQNRKVGYSVSCSKMESSADFSLQGDKFVQMDSVRADHGIYAKPEEYFDSPKYNNNPGKFKMFVYRRYIGTLSRRVENVRNG
jgi:hypothetical protein